MVVEQEEPVKGKATATLDTPLGAPLESGVPRG